MDPGQEQSELHSIDEMGEIIETDTLLNNQTYYRFETLSSDQNQMFLLGEDDGSQFIIVIVGNDTVTAIRYEKGYFYYKW